jgi:hypothetical protein
MKKTEMCLYSPEIVYLNANGVRTLC